MSLFTTQLAVHHNRGIARGSAVRKRLVLLRLLINFLTAVMVGSQKACGFDTILDGEAGAKATGTATFASSSGTVGVVFNGVTVTVTWATSDTSSMTALVTAFNASGDVLVQYLAKMSNTRSQVTLTAVPAGAILRLGPYDFTAVGAAGLVTTWGEFDISGNDTADAAALAAAINKHPQASKYWAATSAAAVVSVFLLSTPAASDGSTSTAMLTTSSAIAIAAQPAVAATGIVVSLKRDRLANCQTLVASGTNVTVSAARLTLGAGGNAVPYEEAANS